MFFMLDYSRQKGDTPTVAERRKTGWGGKRPRAGRKPELERAVRFTLELEESDLEQLQRIADERSASVASVIREAVRRFLARRRKG